jgi:TolA-binding protein
MRFFLIALIALTPLLHANEPSVYGAGDIDGNNPYGLTSTEKGVLQNRRTVQNLKNRVAEQQNRIDGLTTIIEGLNKQVMDLKERLNSSIKSNNQRDNNKTYGLLLELGQMIDQINNNYVTQEDLRSALAGGGTISRTMSNSTYTPSAVQEPSVDISTVYRRAIQLFGQKSYQAAKDSFEQALNQNYKTASSNYYLGEIAYYTQEYHDAIRYYKKSASLHDQAGYMKVLYLHTAIALARTGQNDQAKGFFQFVVDNYPGTRAADIAKKNL